MCLSGKHALLHWGWGVAGTWDMSRVGGEVLVRLRWGCHGRRLGLEGLGCSEGLGVAAPHIVRGSLFCLSWIMIMYKLVLQLQVSGSLP